MRLSNAARWALPALVLAMAALSGIASYCVNGYIPGPGPGGGGPPATATPVPNWTWVENLPSPAVVNQRTYTAEILQCNDAICVTTNWSYIETVLIKAEPIDPCCMGAEIDMTGAFVALTAGVGLRTPGLYANGTVYRYDGYGNNYDRLDWTARGGAQ